jgi:SAM-dependent methyltransferase
MRDLSRFADGSFDIVWHSHSIVFVPDADRVIDEVARVLAPGGVYRASTMHPITFRMYGTWTGTGWGVRRSYFEDGSLGTDEPWEFDDLVVHAPTHEYGHRISDLVNACAAAGMVVDGLWEWSPGEISTRVPIRQARGAVDAEPGSDEALEALLPAFVEWRARKLPLQAAASPRAGSAASGSRKRTGRRAR